MRAATALIKAFLVLLAVYFCVMALPGKARIKRGLHALQTRDVQFLLVVGALVLGAFLAEEVSSARPTQRISVSYRRASSKAVSGARLRP